MPTVLVISSFVSASRVGGGIAPYVLGPMNIDAIHVPTTLFGRHPGFGSPGGGPVDAETMQDMLDGIAANGTYRNIDAVLTGYFADPSQVDVAARAIDGVRAAQADSNAPFVMVDPIMGDADKGLFVPEETAAVLASTLVPRGDLVACNHWEFQKLAGRAPDLEDIIEAAQDSGGDWLVGSIPFKNRFANALISPERAYAAACDIVPGPTPKGTGDLFRLVYLGQKLRGAGEVECLHRAIWSVESVLQIARSLAARGIKLGEGGLPLAACSQLFDQPEEGGFVIPLDEAD